MPLAPKSRTLLWVLCAVHLLTGCGGDPPQQLPGKVAGPPRAAVSPTADALADTARYVFDVPALLALTADQIKAKLGKPVFDGQGSIDEEMHTLEYRRQGYDLSIDYEVKSRRVSRYYLNPHKDMKEPAALLQAVHVIQKDKRYWIRYMKGDDGLYKGIDIIPANARVQDEFGHWVPRDSVL